MRLTASQARARLAAEIHGVLCTQHPDRGPDPVPVVYAVRDDHLGVPIDAVKPKSSTRLRREDNLAADPRAALLIERWDAQDWSRLWWVRAHLHHVPDPAPAVVDALAERLSSAVPQYAGTPFHRVLVFRIAEVSGWAASMPYFGGMGRKPSDDYDYGEPGKWGEPYEMIDDVEGGDDDEDD